MNANTFNSLYYGWEEIFIHKWIDELRHILRYNWI